MSDDKPFAVYDSAHDKIVISGESWSIFDAEDFAEAINAAVTARERKAEAKALREFADSEALKDDFGHGEVVTKHDVRTALRAYADSVEKGER